MSPGEITSGTKLRQRAGLSIRRVDEALVLTNADGRTYGLEATGAQIWEALREPRTVGELCADLLGTYLVDGDKCTAEVMEFVLELKLNGLIETSE
jgi:Coenzyme PQQ synthesis protein D (PqqD)